MILVSLFQKTMFYLLKSKYAIFSNFIVTKIERSAFLGDSYQSVGIVHNDVAMTNGEHEPR